MRNSEIATILYAIAFYLEMDGVQFKPRAYEKAARSVESLEEDIEKIYRRGGIKALQDIPGVGKNIALKIEELINTGKLQYYEDLREKIPVDLKSLSTIEGLGPKTVKTLYKELGIRNIEDLEKATREHRISRLPGFKAKTEQNILKGIEFARQNRGRFILGFTIPLIRDIQERLRRLREVKAVQVAGSVRRMKETIGDVDFLAISDHPRKVMDYFVSMPEVIDVVEKGETRASVRLDSGIDADLRVLAEESFGAALQYFTGSKDHNIALRRIAQERGWRLSEYGLFEGERRVAGESESRIYEKLGMSYIPPELREDAGEIEAAKERRLPDLIEYGDLRGDTQVHTDWTDGIHSISQMAEEAVKLGLEYIVISDHSQTLAMAGGLDEESLSKQGEEIDELNDKKIGIRVLKGVELNVMKDGRLDIEDRVLEGLDVVGAGIHSNFNMDKQEMTKGIRKALENPNLDILYHPTARQMQKRDPINLDIESVLESAEKTGTVLDIDSYPDRLDLKDEYIRKAVQRRVKLCISSDAHSKSHLRYTEFGIAQARRGWAQADNIVNTRRVQDLQKMLK